MSSARPAAIHYGSSSSSSSSDSDIPTYRPSMDTVPAVAVSVQTIRCMRCAASTEVTTTDDPGTYGMVRISTNLYYCDRCAKSTGFK